MRNIASVPKIIERDLSLWFFGFLFVLETVFDPTHRNIGSNIRHANKN